VVRTYDILWPRKQFEQVGGPDRVQDAHTYVFAAALRGDERAVRRASELTYLIHHGPSETRAQIGQALADAVPPPPAMPANFNFDAPVTGGWELPPPGPPGSY